MTEKALVITVPIVATEYNSEQGVVPYGPAVVSGILTANGFDSTTWDLNIDLFRKFEADWPTIVDMFATRGYRPDLSKNVNVKKILSQTRKYLKNKLNSIKPDVVLLSVFSSHSLDFLIPLSVMIKELKEDCYVMAGGRGFDNTDRQSQLNYADLYSGYLPIDCIYRGDAENEMISAIKQRYKGVYHAAPVSAEVLESIPRPSWKGYDFDKYKGYETKNIRFPITGSKGCVRDCTFCDVKESWPKFVYRKGEDIAREIIDTYHESGIYKYEFTDNLVNGSISNFRTMNTVIANELPNTIDYLGYAICRSKQSMPAEDFKLAATAGAKLFKIGIESGSEKVRNDMKKKFSNDDIAWFAENCADNNIKQVWLMFVGYPTETEEDFQASIELLKQHQHLAKAGLVEVFLSFPMMLTTGSGFMRSYASEYGLEHNQYDSWSDFFWTSTKFKDNNFEVRANRWRRFVEAIDTYGFQGKTQRQQEKFRDLEGIEKIYAEYSKDAKKVIPIANGVFNINKETHL